MPDKYIQCACGLMLPATILKNFQGQYYIGAECWSCACVKRETGDFHDLDLLRDMFKSGILTFNLELIRRFQV